MLRINNFPTRIWEEDFRNWIEGANAFPSPLRYALKIDCTKPAKLPREVIGKNGMWQNLRKTETDLIRSWRIAYLVYRATVRRLFKEAGFHYWKIIIIICYKKNNTKTVNLMQEREKSAKQHLKGLIKGWKLHFSDEFSASKSGHSRRGCVFGEHNERKDNCLCPLFESGNVTLMVWGVVTNYTTPKLVCFVDGKSLWLQWTACDHCG